jgi:hypothetical protein
VSCHPPHADSPSLLHPKHTDSPSLLHPKHADSPSLLHPKQREGVAQSVIGQKRVLGMSLPVPRHWRGGRARGVGGNSCVAHLSFSQWHPI